MKRKISMLFLMVFLAVFAVACGAKTDTSSSTNTQSASPANESTAAKPSGELTIKHKLGEFKLTGTPQKIVVFDFGALDTLDKLGVEAAGVPTSNLPSYLSKYKDAKYANVGTLMEPNFEKINEVQPDLIIISGRQQNAYAEFSKIAPTLFVGLDNKNYMESFTENVKTIAKIFGKEAKADQELAAINESVKKVKDKASASGKNALVTLVTGGKISAYGPGSRFGLIHDVIGLKPADDKIEVSTHGQSVGPEYIAEKNPDYLFVVDRDAAVVGGDNQSAKQVIENDLIKKTKAYQNSQVVYLDPNYWYLSGGGLVSVAQMVSAVDQSLK